MMQNRDDDDFPSDENILQDDRDRKVILRRDRPSLESLEPPKGCHAREAYGLPPEYEDDDFDAQEFIQWLQWLKSWP